MAPRGRCHPVRGSSRVVPEPPGSTARGLLAGVRCAPARVERGAGSGCVVIQPRASRAVWFAHQPLRECHDVMTLMGGPSASGAVSGGCPSRNGLPIETGPAGAVGAVPPGTAGSVCFLARGLTVASEVPAGFVAFTVATVTGNPGGLSGANATCGAGLPDSSSCKTSRARPTGASAQSRERAPTSATEAALLTAPVWLTQQRRFHD